MHSQSEPIRHTYPKFELSKYDLDCLRIEQDDLERNFRRLTDCYLVGGDESALRVATRIRQRISNACGTFPDQHRLDGRKLPSKEKERVYNRVNSAYKLLGINKKHHLQSIILCEKALSAVAVDIKSLNSTSILSVVFEFSKRVLIDNPLRISFDSNVLLSIYVLIFGEFERYLTSLKADDKWSHSILVTALDSPVSGSNQTFELNIAQRIGKFCSKINDKFIKNDVFDENHLSIIQEKINNSFPLWIKKFTQYYYENYGIRRDSVKYDILYGVENTDNYSSVEELLKRHGIPDGMTNRALISDILERAVLPSKDLPEWSKNILAWAHNSICGKSELVNRGRHNSLCARNLETKSGNRKLLFVVTSEEDGEYIAELFGVPEVFGVSHNQDEAIDIALSITLEMARIAASCRTQEEKECLMKAQLICSYLVN